MKKRVCVIPLGLMVLLCACRANTFTAPSNSISNEVIELHTDLSEATSRSNIETVRLENYDVRTEVYDNSDDSKQISISIYYPQISGLKTITLQNDINALIKEAALKPYNDIVKANNGIVKGTDWSIDYSITYATDDVLSIKFEGYLYVQGNANGINWVYSTNIDLTSGKRITMDDIFQSSFKEKMDYQYFRCIDVDMRDAEEAALNEIFARYKDNFDMSDDNFYFTMDKFIIILPIDNYYQFAASYKDLKSCLREDNLLWNLILDKIR